MESRDGRESMQGIRDGVSSTEGQEAHYLKKKLTKKTSWYKRMRMATGAPVITGALSIKVAQKVQERREEKMRKENKEK